MKKLLFAIQLLALVLTLPANAMINGNARISLLKGDVLMQTVDTGAEWVAASVNTPVNEGDKIWSPEDGRAEIQFTGAFYLRADSNTEIEITKMSMDADDRIIQFALPQGRVYANYKGYYSRNSVLQFDTPFVSVMAYGDARFDLNILDNGLTEVSVFDGTVFVESRTGSTKVRAGNMLSIGPDNYAEISPRSPKDAWQSWNLSRDSQLTATRTSSRYLPPSLSVYCSDLDEYGRWTYVTDYGYVWTPRLAVQTWAPYRHGRWVWMNGDYIWVSYEPWGWLPYHYGRWSFRTGIGWFWVPPALNAVFWSPGFVAWTYTPDYVSWVPLAPGEIYYGYGHYGPHSVNLHKVNIKNVNITNIYINSRVNNAVTVVHKDTFLTGRHAVPVNAPLNPFLSGGRISPGRPDIKPVRATVMPDPNKMVHDKSLPSRHIIEKMERHKIKERPIAIRDRVSVFKPDRMSEPMRIRKSDNPKPAPKIHAPKTVPNSESSPAEKQITTKPAMPDKVKEKPFFQDRKLNIKAPGTPEKSGGFIHKKAPDNKLERQTIEKPKHEIQNPKHETVNPKPRTKDETGNPDFMKKPEPGKRVIMNTF